MPNLHLPRLRALLVAVIVAVGLAVAGSASAAQVSASLSAVPGSPTQVRLVLGNTGTEAESVPRWLTGAQGIVDPILDVARDGAPAPYTGMLAKRADAVQADLVTIAPGAEMGWTLDVASAYDLPVAGAYSVRYRATLPDGTVIASNAVGIVASPEVAAASRAKSLSAWGGAGQQAITYTGCTTPRETQLTAALSAADDYARDAVAYFTAGYRGARYVRWFGAMLQARWNTASAHFTAVQAVTGGTSASFDCSGTGCGGSGTFAFVYPNVPYEIHLCDAFWAAALTGTDSRAGTLIHEITHFTVVAGTDDHVYGQTGAANLAVSNPGQAVDNADNHEYFAENTPVYNATYTAAASSYNVSAREVGTTSPPVTIVLTSSGNQPLAITSIAASGDFAVESSTCTGATLAPAASCTASVTFAPTAVGARSGTLTVNGAVDTAGTSVSLAGIGSAAPAPAGPDPAPVAAPVALPVAAPAPTSPGMPALPRPTVPTLSSAVLGLRTVTTRAPMVTRFAARPGATYAVTARLGRRSVRGACRVVGGEAACTVRMRAPGAWRVAITPTTNGRRGVAVGATVRVRR